MTEETSGVSSPAAVPPVSPDGRFWWDGRAWQAMPHAAPQPPPPPPVPPTAWGLDYGAPRQFGPPPTQGNGLSIAGIVCGAIAFLFFPIVFGPVGLILGGVAMSKGEQKAVVALVVAGCGTVVGMILGAIFWSGL